MAQALRKTLTRLIGAQVCLHAAMTGLRMAAPLMALREGFSPAAVGLLLALFALSQVFLALPAGRFTDRHGMHRPVRLAVIVAVGIALIHRHNGWFVGEHGTGGSEYSVALLAMLLVIAAHDAARHADDSSRANKAHPT